MEFDIHDLRGVMSAIMLITFLGIFVWTWRGSRDRFRDAAMLALDDPDQPGEARGEHRR